MTDFKKEFSIKNLKVKKGRTIIQWEDGTYTSVKCSDEDTFDSEKGIALCFMKKALGNKGAFNDVLRNYVKKEYDISYDCIGNMVVSCNDFDACRNLVKVIFGSF